MRNLEQPVPNLAIQRKMEADAHERHLARLRAIKPSVDNKPPRRPPLHRSPAARSQRKSAFQTERDFAIAYENALLLQKLRNIMAHPQNPAFSADAAPLPPPRSLNTMRRRQELERIARENHGIVHRIRGVSSAYEASKWETEFRETRQLLKRLSKPPRHHLSATAPPLSPLQSRALGASPSPTGALSPMPLPSLSRSKGTTPTNEAPSTLGAAAPALSPAAAALSSPARTSVKPTRVPPPNPKPIVRLPDSMDTGPSLVPVATLQSEGSAAVLVSEDMAP